MDLEDSDDALGATLDAAGGSLVDRLRSPIRGGRGAERCLRELARARAPDLNFWGAFAARAGL